MCQVWDMGSFTGTVRLIISFNSLYNYHLNTDIHSKSFAELNCNWKNRDTFKCVYKTCEINEMGGDVGEGRSCPVHCQDCEVGGVYGWFAS